MKRRTLLIVAAAALLYTAPGLVPGHLLVPADLPRDYGAWKHNPAVRIRVSNTLLSDVPRGFMPWDLAARGHLLRGEMPWRNALAADGEPLFANPLAGLLSPFTWPRIAAGLQGWAWTVLLKILVAALSMYWLARVLAIDERAAMISALVFALSGYATVWALYPHTNVLVVLPALAAAAISLAREASTRNVLLVGATAALATAGGHPETLCVGVVAITAFLLAARERLMPFLRASLAGFLLLGVQLVPFALLLARSHVVIARTIDIPPRFRCLSIFSMILPGYLGSPLRSELDLTGLFPFAENFHQRNGAYVGALVLFALAMTYRSLPVVIRRALIIGVIALLLSWTIPGIANVLRLLPLIKWVAPDYYGIAFVLFASLASGPAILALSARRGAGILLMVAGVVLLMIGLAPMLAPSLLTRLAHLGIAYLQRTGLLHQTAAVYDARLTFYLASAKWTALRRLAMPALCWIVFAIGLLLGRRTLATTAAIAELMAFGYGYSPAISVEEVAPEPPAITEVKRLDPQRQWFLASSNDVFPPNLATLYGVRDVHAYQILAGETTVRSLETAGYDPFSFTLPPDPSPVQRAALARMGVRWFITWRGVMELPNAALPRPASNAPPDGLKVGILCSAAGALLLLLLALLPLDGARRLR